MVFRGVQQRRILLQRRHVDHVLFERQRIPAELRAGFSERGRSAILQIVPGLLQRESQRLRLRSFHVLRLGQLLQLRSRPRIVRVRAEEAFVSRATQSAAQKAELHAHRASGISTAEAATTLSRRQGADVYEQALELGRCDE